MSNGTSGGIFVCTMTKLNESCQEVVDSSTTGMLTYFSLTCIYMLHAKFDFICLSG